MFTASLTMYKKNTCLKFFAIFAFFAVLIVVNSQTVSADTVSQLGRDIVYDAGTDGNAVQKLGSLTGNIENIVLYYDSLGTSTVRLASFNSSGCDPVVRGFVGCTGYQDHWVQNVGTTTGFIDLPVNFTVTDPSRMYFIQVLEFTSDTHLTFYGSNNSSSYPFGTAFDGNSYLQMGDIEDLFFVINGDIPPVFQGPNSTRIISVSDPISQNSPYLQNALRVRFSYDLDSNEQSLVYGCFRVFDLTASGNMIAERYFYCDPTPLDPNSSLFSIDSYSVDLIEGHTYGFIPALSYSYTSLSNLATTNVPPMTTFYAGTTTPADFNSFYYATSTASTTSVWTCEWDIPLIITSLDPCETAYYLTFPQPGSIQTAWLKAPPPPPPPPPPPHTHHPRDIFFSFANATATTQQITYSIDIFGAEMPILATGTNPFLGEDAYNVLRLLEEAFCWLLLGFAIWATRNKIFT